MFGPCRKPRVRYTRWKKQQVQKRRVVEIAGSKAWSCGSDLGVEGEPKVCLETVEVMSRRDDELESCCWKNRLDQIM